MNAQQFQHQILCYSDKLYRMARSVLKDESLSKDAYQELMVRLWEKRIDLEAVKNRRFLLTSMRNPVSICCESNNLTGDPQNMPYSNPAPINLRKRPTW